MPGVVAIALYDWNYFFAQLVARPDHRQPVRPAGARLHDGVRDPQAAELRPRRRLHDGRVHRVLRPDGARGIRVAGGAMALLFALMFGAAMIGCGVLGVVIERFAYRPLRRAPRIAPLISALGVSFFLQQTAVLIFGPIPKQYDTYSLDGGEALRHGLDRKPAHPVRPAARDRLRDRAHGRADPARSPDDGR